MVIGAPTTAAASAAMPASAAEVASITGTPVASASRPANSAPTRVPMNSEAKNRPPRKPKPSEMPEARHFRASSPPIQISGSCVVRSRCSAPWPDDSTCGLARASGISSRPPTTGRPHSGSGLRLTVPSIEAISASPGCRPSRSSSRAGRRWHSRRRGHQSSKRQAAGRPRSRLVGHERTGQRGHRHRRQCGRGVGADDDLEGVERTGQGAPKAAAIAPAAPAPTRMRTSLRRRRITRPSCEPLPAPIWVYDASSPTEAPQPLESRVWVSTIRLSRIDMRPPCRHWLPPRRAAGA